MLPIIEYFSLKENENKILKTYIKQTNDLVDALENASNIHVRNMLVYNIEHIDGLRVSFKKALKYLELEISN